MNKDQTQMPTIVWIGMALVLLILVFFLFKIGSDLTAQPTGPVPVENTDSQTYYQQTMPIDRQDSASSSVEISTSTESTSTEKAPNAPLIDVK